jgi:hypothetical protein
MWENARPGHSAVPFPGRPYVFETDEVYGTYFVPTYGCPWGWALILDVTDPERPSIVSEYKVRENTQEFCDSPENTPETNHLNTYTAHNPTLTRNLALVTSSSAGATGDRYQGPLPIRIRPVGTRRSLSRRLQTRILRRRQGRTRS